MIERDFDIPFIADLALREKQIQQNYRPVIAVHKWFARRPGTLFRGLILSEFASVPLKEAFYQANSLRGIRVADPFMGGGTPLLEANRLGCDTVGCDINPMAYWIVKEELEHLDVGQYRRAAERLRAEIEKDLGRIYRTTCLECGSPEASAKYFLWVKVQRCRQCQKEVSLFPGHLIAEDRRHPANVLLCPQCGKLNERKNRQTPGACGACKQPLSLSGPARGNHCECPHCGSVLSYPDPEEGPPRHRLFAIEYYCPACKPRHEGRFFKAPDEADFDRAREAETAWARMRPRFVPDAEIPGGDETGRLHRWGYTRYRQMFNARQLLGLESSCRIIDKESDQRIRNALATNLSDLLRYQNMLCRYDTMALKSLDIFSVHGFPVGLIQCESNLLGIRGPGGASIGSGGWSNIVEKFAKAKAYCDAPFEIRHVGGRKVIVGIPGEWIGDSRNGGVGAARRSIRISCGDAAKLDLPAGSLDGVFTDPPYFGNVQYAELMDFCYVWLRGLVGKTAPAFARPSTRTPDELTGNENMGRGLEHFTEGLSAVFQRMARALKPGAPLVFTYHHNDLRAYGPLAVAVLDAGLVSSASLPCPAEMGASIHISGTGSSIIDTVFVCRSTGRVPKRWIARSPAELATLVSENIEGLQGGGVQPTKGDVRCITFGHLIRLAIWNLRGNWNRQRAAKERLAAVGDWIERFGGLGAVENELAEPVSALSRVQAAGVREGHPSYGARHVEISF